MMPCRTCLDFFERVGSDGFCTVPFVVEKKIQPVDYSNFDVWMLAIFFGSAGAFIGLVLMAGIFLVIR